MRTTQFQRLVLLSAVQAALFDQVCKANISSSWINAADGFWTDNTAWSPSIVPNDDQPDAGDLYDAFIGATGSPYQVSLASDITINSLTLNSSNATISQSDGTFWLLNGGTIANGNYQLSGGTLLSDATFNVQSELDFTGGTIGGAGTIQIAPNGVANIGANTATYTLSTQFNNAGTVNLQAGTFTLSGGTLTNQSSGVINLTPGAMFATGTGSNNMIRNSGLMNVNAGNGSVILSSPLLNSATISINSGSLTFASGTYNENAGAVFNGPGLLDLGSAYSTFHVLNGTTTFAGNTNFNTGTLTGVGAAIVTGTFNWLGGTVANYGKMQINPGGILNISGNSHYINTEIDNDGTTNLYANANVYGGYPASATFVNASTAVMNILGNATISASYLNVQNYGTININAGGGTVTMPALVNAGTVSVAGGTAVFGNGLTCNAGAVFTGAGTTILSQAVTLNSTLTLASGNAQLNGYGTFITGAGNLVIAGATTWNEGSISGSGSIDILSGATLSLGYEAGGLGRAIYNAGVINSGASKTINGGTIINQAGGIINLSSSLYANTINNGSIIVNVGSYTVGFGSLTNAATINLMSGSLVLGGGTQTTGATLIGNGFIELTGSSAPSQVLNGDLKVTGTNTNMDGGTLSGAGSLNILGTFNFNSGLMTGSGMVNVVNGATMNIGSLSNSSTLSRMLNNSGTLNLVGSLSLNNGTINNLSSGYLNMGSKGYFNAGFISGGTVNLNNSGTISLTSASMGTVNVQNSGTIIANSGTCVLGGGIENTGAVLNGTAYVDLTGGSLSNLSQTLNDTFTVNATNVNLTGGTVTGPGNLQINGALTWAGGTLSGTGSVNIAQGATMNMPYAYSRTLSRAIFNSGTLNIAGGSLTSSGTITNLATGVVNVTGYLQVMGSYLLNNFGTLNVPQSDPLYSVVDAGTINISANATASYVGSFLDGAYIAGLGTFNVGSSGLNETVNGHTTFAASNAVFGDGTLTGSGDLEVADALRWDLGTFSGSGEIDIDNGASLNLTHLGYYRILSRQLNSFGQMNLTVGSLQLANGTLTNESSGTAIVNSPYIPFVLTAGSGTARINNEGNFLTTAGTLSCTVPFSNVGTFVVGANNTGSPQDTPCEADLTGGVSQLVNGTLVQGTWIVRNNATLTLGSATILNNAATITLDGSTSSFPAINPIQSNSGTFAVTNGRQFNTTGSYRNSGTTIVGPASVVDIDGTLTNSGTIDVSNALLLDGASNTSFAVAEMLAAGFAAGSWNGPGIDSSSASSTAADPSQLHKTALGFATASDIGITAPTSFDGETIDPSTIIVMYTFSGDANLDGTVDSTDFAILAANYGKTGATWDQGDYNYDGTVNALDFNALATNYGQSLSSGDLPDPAMPFASALVPEPVVVMIPLLLALNLLRRRPSARP